MYCESCGKPLDPHDRFCESCGAPAPEANLAVSLPAPPAGSRRSADSHKKRNFFTKKRNGGWLVLIAVIFFGVQHYSEIAGALASGGPSTPQVMVSNLDPDSQQAATNDAHGESIDDVTGPDVAYAKAIAAGNDVDIAPDVLPSAVTQDYVNAQCDVISTAQSQFFAAVRGGIITFGGSNDQNIAVMADFVKNINGSKNLTTTGYLLLGRIVASKGHLLELAEQGYTTVFGDCSRAFVDLYTRLNDKPQVTIERDKAQADAQAKERAEAEVQRAEAEAQRAEAAAQAAHNAKVEAINRSFQPAQDAFNKATSMYEAAQRTFEQDKDAMASNTNTFRDAVERHDRFMRLARTQMVGGSRISPQLYQGVQRVLARAQQKWAQDQQQWAQAQQQWAQAQQEWAQAQQAYRAAEATRDQALAQLKAKDGR